MAYPLHVDAQANTLDAMFGDDRGAKMPAAWQVALFDGDPTGDGVELDSVGGYVRPVVANDSATFPDATPEKESAPITFATATGAWSGVATHFLLYDAANPSVGYFAGLLGQEVEVLVAGTVVKPTLRLYWNTES